ncbi:MAG TPA: TrbI/VirB10 family protein [Sphingomonas sp.]
MIATDVAAARDPRLAVPDEDLAQASARAAPEVGRPASAAEGMGLAVGIIGAAMIGGFTMLSLAHHHADAAAAKAAPPVVAAAPIRAAPILPPPPAPIVAATTPPAATVAAPHVSSVLVLDNEPPSFPGHGGRPVPAAGAPAGSGSHQDGSFSPDEQFAARAGDEPVPTSHLTHLDHPAEVVAQGTIIPAVLETAINSDLPGYARALVSRDVRSFDGSKVLVPRGSRLIGQYKSALQAGQSRALVVWNRLLRPDGTSIQLGSPATDDVGETGLAGKVNSHFFQRFGSAILLSVIDGLAGAIGGSGNTVVLGSVGGSSGAAGVALQNQIKISPTVRVMQGTPIQVFAARDLDFTDDGQ